MKSELKATVTNIQRFCLDDGPGVRTTVFLKGCPLRCIWCHNPETNKAEPECMQRDHRCVGCGKCVAACPSGARMLALCTDNTPTALVDRSKCTACGKCADVCMTDACEICGREMTVDEVLDVVRRDMDFYSHSGGGMTVSGGECAMYPKFTSELVRQAKEAGINAAYETCGFGDKQFFLDSAKLGVLFLYDLKEMDSDKHKKLTGVGNEKILENLEALMQAGAEIIIRMPLIPGVNDSDDELCALAEFLEKNKGRYKGAQIMPYHALGVGKAESLGLSQMRVDDELARDECASSKERWNGVFAEHGINLLK